MYISLADAIANGGGIERKFTCPVHDDTNPSASVNVVKGLWTCYSCGASGKIDENYEIPDEDFSRQVRKALQEEGPRTYPESWLSLFTSRGPGEYWLSRFTKEACEHFGLGQDLDGEWATYPLRDPNGTILGVVRRTLTGDKRKYKYPYGVDVSELLFNYHQCSSDTLVLVEGATDVVAAWEAGYDAVAVLGVNATDEQVRLIRRYQPARVILAFDQDRAGDHLAAEWATKLAFDTVVFRPEWKGGKDLASLPVEKRGPSLDGRLDRVTKVRIRSGHGTQRRDHEQDGRVDPGPGFGSRGKRGGQGVTVRVARTVGSAP